MSVPFDLHVTSPLPLGDLVGRLTLEGGEELPIVLREGRFQGVIPKLPILLRLLADEAPPGTHDLRVVTEDEEGTTLPEGTAVAFEELFENGIPVTDTTVRLQLVWGLHCHAGGMIAPNTARSLMPASDDTDCNDRFGSWEHIQCAARIGLFADNGKLELKDGFLDIHAGTPLPLRKGALEQTFGEIIALAGDYYAYLDETARQDCRAAWPPAKGLVRLAGDYTSPTLDAEEPAVLLDILNAAQRDRDSSKDKLGEASLLAQDGLFGRYPVRRYLALASQNFCHFRSLSGTADKQDVGALKWYTYYHDRALKAAKNAGLTNDRDALKQALVIDAFGCHFLTDLFAAGHMRVPRRILGERLGIWRGSLGLAHEMHCEDNKSGLWCTTNQEQTPRRVWLAFGDAMLFSPRSLKRHVKVVQEAVRRSVEEVAAAYDGQSLPVEEQAMALVPVPLPPGEQPTEDDVLPLSQSAHTRDHYDSDCPGNSYPLIVYLAEHDLLVRRCGSSDVNVYSDLKDRLPELFSIDFSAPVPRMGNERIPRLT